MAHILTADEKVVVVTLDLQNAVAIEGHRTLKTYKPSKQVIEILSIDEIKQVLEYLEENRIIFGYWRNKMRLNYGAPSVWLYGSPKESDIVFTDITVDWGKTKELIENLSGKAELLPQITQKVNEDFTICKPNLVYFQQKNIKLEPQEAKMAIKIMSKPIGYYTTREELVDCLANNYTEKAKSDKQIYQLIISSLSSIRKQFRSATGSDRDYFPNKQGSGYKFSP